MVASSHKRERDRERERGRERGSTPTRDVRNMYSKGKNQEILELW